MAKIEFEIYFDPTDPPELVYEDGVPYIAFDDTDVKYIYVEFVCPAFSGTPTFNIPYSMASATANDVDFEVEVMAVTPGDSSDIGTESYDTANSANETVPGTAGYLSELSISLSNDDGMAEGDYVRLRISRDADDGTNDDATGDCNVRTTMYLDYTAA